MNLNLSEHLPLIASAPDGIQKLRGLILDLAIRGKLVPQDAKNKPKPTTLGLIGKWAVGSGFPTAEQGIADAEILFAKVSDMNLPGNSRFILTTNNSISHQTAAKLRVNIHPAGTVIFPKIGGAIATNKRRILVRDTAIDNNCLGLIPCAGVSTDWLFLLLSSIDFTQYQAGTSVPALAQGVLAEIPVILPSSDEQHRIVDKVDELMALCDRLETEQNQSSAAHTQLVETLLGTLTQSTDSADFEANWQRIAAHFDTLFTTETSIVALEKSILQLAVMGKLVTQDTNDHASDLLKTVEEENAQSRKKPKPQLPITNDLIPFQAPQSWEWVRLGALFNIVYGKGLSTSQLTDVGYDVFGANGIIGCFNSFLYENPQLLISCRGAYSGKANISPPHCFITSNSLVLENSWKNLELKYFYYALTIADKSKIVTGSAQPQVTTTNLDPFIICVPPLAEQRRIVAKVDELMAICDQLKAQLAESKVQESRLADTLIQSALSIAA